MLPNPDDRPAGLSEQASGLSVAFAFEFDLVRSVFGEETTLSRFEGKPIGRARAALASCLASLKAARVRPTRHLVPSSLSWTSGWEERCRDRRARS
jgi:hypothetical protein